MAVMPITLVALLWAGAGVGASTDSFYCPTYTAAFGHVESENGKYKPASRRCWRIEPPGARSITLSFKSFRTEASYDRLLVYDGPSESSPRLGRPSGYSGDELPEPLRSSGGSMLLVFASDLFVATSGFTFAWTSASSAAPLPAGSCAEGCARSSVGDGACDPPCYNGGCDFDGSDCDGVCDMATGCELHEAGDHTCDERCMSAGCDFDARDCECSNVLDAPYG